MNEGRRIIRGKEVWKNGKKIGELVWGNVIKVERKPLTPELEKEFSEIRKDFAKGMAKLQAEREEKRRRAEKNLENFVIPRHSPFPPNPCQPLSSVIRNTLIRFL